MLETILVPRKSNFNIELNVNFHIDDLCKDVSVCRNCHKDFDEKLGVLYENGASIDTLLNLRTNFVDKFLSKLFCLFNLDQYTNLSLIAVGGYGRKELFLRSDIDFLILFDETLSTECSNAVEQFISFLWDIKLDIGSSVRDIKSCVRHSQEDITIRTNLLETRLIFGNKDNYLKLKQALKDDSYWLYQSFINAKVQEQKQRHNNYTDTTYTLEPDIKNNIGGIRDLQTILWVANFYLGANTYFDMYRMNLLEKNEFEDLNAAKIFLYEIRYALHTIVNRSDNRLTLDRQKQVASILGYGDEGNHPVEKMMKGLFIVLKQVRELNNIALQVICSHILNNEDQEDKTIFIDNNFVIRGNLLDIVDNDAFKQDPSLMLELFYNFAVYKDIENLHFNCIRALRDARRKLKYYLIEDPKCRKSLKKILSNPACLERCIGYLNNYRILSAYMPPWENIEGQTQFDMFHIFPVDEHTIRALKNIYEFTTCNDENYSLFKNIFYQINEPLILITATFLHDIAKGRGGSHAILGAKDATFFCQIHDYTQYQQRLVTFLVRNHLSMSNTAQRRDITDFEVINDFAVQVDDEDHLNMLYCLSVVDIAATNAREWTSWKDSMFRQLFFATRQTLRHGLADPSDLKSHAEENKLLALRHITNHHEQKIRVFWSKFQAQYFIQYTPFEIAWHTKNILSNNFEDNKNQTLILFSQHDDYVSELLMYTKGNQNSFANIVCIMAKKKLNIQSAQIVRTNDKFSLCTIKFQNQKGAKYDNERLSSLRQSIIKELDNKPSLDGLNSPTKKIFNIKTNIVFIEDKQRRHTNLEVSTLDSFGLLAKIVVTLYSLDCAIITAKITTTGERADDFFAISTANGKILSSRKQEKLKKALLKAIDD